MPLQVKYLFLTHADDVADHFRWAAEMGLKRIIHATEAHARDTLFPETSGARLEEAEVKLQGCGPWDPFDGELGPATHVLYQPGHTKGCTVLHFQPHGAARAAVFTGDHLAVLRQTGSLDAFTAFNKLSHERQLQSIKRWAEEPAAEAVALVLPGHGRKHVTDCFPDDLRGVAQRMAARMEEGKLEVTHNAN
jgi:glyoxylase-like metal-dependent hydrolase (beta-lactamase superfamily II)